MDLAESSGTLTAQVTAQCSCCGQQVGTSAYMCSSETGDLTVIRGLQQVFQQQDS